MEGDGGDGNPAGSTMTDTMTTVRTAALQLEEEQKEMEEVQVEDATDKSEPTIMEDREEIKAEEEKPDKSGMQEKYAGKYLEFQVFLQFTFVLFFSISHLFPEMSLNSLFVTSLPYVLLCIHSNSSYVKGWLLTF